MKKIQDKKSMKTTRNALALYTSIIQRCYEREQMKDEPDVEELIRLKTMKDDAIKAMLMLIPNWQKIEHSAPVSGNNLDELIDLIESLKDKEAKKSRCNGKGRIQNDQCNEIHNQSDPDDR